MIIKLENISKKYKNLSVFDSFSYSFTNGKIYILYGTNGSGKTTLLKCIATLIDTDAGELIVNGSLVSSCRDYKEYRSKVSIMTHYENSLVNDLTIKQNIMFFLGINNESYKKRKHMIDKLIDGFQLKDYVDKEIRALSRGTKQKAAIIVTLMRRTELILFDEPFDGLDAVSLDYFKKTLNDYCSSSIIILTSPVEIDDDLYIPINLNKI